MQMYRRIYLITNWNTLRNMMSKILIIAPHADDELIGCFTVLNTNPGEVDVVVMYELDAIRKNELNHCADIMQFNVIDNLSFGESTLSDYNTIYVPTKKDSHSHHKLANLKYRKFATIFYSVDMVDAYPLSEKDSISKKAILDAAYPSQSKLWDTNEKYFLFESLHTSDVVSYKKIQHTSAIFGKLVVSTDIRNHGFISVYLAKVNDNRSIEDIESDIVSICGNSYIDFYWEDLNIGHRY